jgi:hypothetical protein
MGSNLSVINDTLNREPVEVWVFLSGSRTFNSGYGDMLNPIKLNVLEFGYQIKYGLGKVWYDIFISPDVETEVPVFIYGQG